MTAIEKYYELLHKIDICNFKIRMLENYPDEKDDLINEKERHGILNAELTSTKNELSEKSEDAEAIRTALIYVANAILANFNRIRRWGSHYPDLGQGMIIPGYLFGKILDDFKTVLRSEGDHPFIEIYMSEKEWDYSPLQSVLEACRDELVRKTFISKIEAIEYYEAMRGSILEIVDDLRTRGMI